MKMNLTDWKITTNHAASSYGIPVLVSPTGKAFGPNDEIELGEFPGIPPVSAAALAKALHTDGIASESEWMRFATLGRFDNYAAMMAKS